MANYGMFGYLKTEDSTICKYAKVYPYFKKVATSSPDSKWSDTPYTSDINGYYGYDLGDDVLLGTEASIVKGTDKVYLAIVWNENDINDQDKNSLTFTHCMFIEHLTTNADFFELNLTLEAKRLPILDSITFPDSNILTSHSYTVAETSHADYTWKSLAPFSENEISQKLLYDLVPIFDGHQMINTIYDWKEIAPREISNSSNDSYVYDIAGVYDVCVTIQEKWNTEVTQCKQIIVKYNLPVPDFNWTPVLTNDWQGSKIKGQETITFHNLSEDLDDRTWDVDKWAEETYYYEWTITDELYNGTDNTQVYSSKDFYFEPSHDFQSPGTKTITLNLYWNDGFDDYIETISKTIEIFAFDIVPDFTWDIISPINRNELVTFNPDGTSGDVFQINNYHWIIEDNYPEPLVDLYTFDVAESSIFNEGSSDNTLRVDNTYTFESEQYPQVRFHSTEVKTITLTMTYFNGWVDVEESISKDLTPQKYSTIPEFTISDITPMGRDKLIEFINTTSYIRGTEDIGYTIDWRLEDFYTECNLDNPEPGVITDNKDYQLDVLKDTNLYHNFQNTDINNIELTIRYDDGWQMQTKRLTQQVTPIVYPEPIPDIIWTPEIPQGRDVLVQINDNTVYDYTRYRGIDWIIEDYYSACNLDNASTEDVDNTKYYTRELHETTIEHHFQSPVEHEIDMTIYFDDGFCERSVNKIEVIEPIVYPEPIPDFDWDIIPTSRYELVTFTNTTEDINNRFRAYDWVINDHYNLFNPDNINYSTNITDNTAYYFNEIDYNFEPTHFFQDNTTEDIQMTYHYDDGYCDRTVEITKQISKTEYSIVPDFITDITPINNGFYGKNEINYFNNSTGDITQMLDEKWTWNDRVFGTEADNITIRDDEPVDALQPFTFNTPSRAPYSAINGSTEQNINKDVSLEIRIDTGWRDDTLAGNYLDSNNLEDGGQVYFYISKSFEATPFELDSNITYECNIDNYTH